jgi:hypothetical protein
MPESERSSAGNVKSKQPTSFLGPSAVSADYAAAKGDLMKKAIDWFHSQ